MLDKIDYAARVQRGIALLDEKWPTWAQDIDLDRLDIRSTWRCMTAQYSAVHGGEGTWADGMQMLDLTRREYEEHGFNGDESEDGEVLDSAYDTLNALWRSVIARWRGEFQQEASAQ